MSTVRKKLVDKLRRIANHTASTLGHYLPAIEEKFAPSTEIFGELEDCKEAIEEALSQIREEEKE